MTMNYRHRLARLVLAVVTATIGLALAGATPAVTSPKPPGCGTSTTPQCEVA
jgi:hypothetical protein